MFWMGIFTAQFRREVVSPGGQHGDRAVTPGILVRRLEKGGKAPRRLAGRNWAVKIPIQNIYYLLCYAWDKLAEKDVVAVEDIPTTTLADLFARVLINGTNHLLKRGFD